MAHRISIDIRVRPISLRVCFWCILVDELLRTLETPRSHSDHFVPNVVDFTTMVSIVSELNFERLRMACRLRARIDQKILITRHCMSWMIAERVFRIRTVTKSFDILPVAIIPQRSTNGWFEDMLAV